MPWRGHGVNEADMYLALECAEVDALKALPVVSAPGIYKPKNKAKAKLNDWHVKPTLNCTGRCGGKPRPHRGAHVRQDHGLRSISARLT